MSQIPNIIVIDCDGVLTDGTLTIDSQGEKLFKKFHTRDVRAIRQLVASGFEVYIVSADDWNGTRHFAEKVGAEFVCMKDKSKVAGFVGSRPYIAVGDDAWDIPMMKAAAISCCPQDAITLVEDHSHIVLGVDGGKGVIAKLLEWIVEQKSKVE